MLWLKDLKQLSLFEMCLHLRKVSYFFLLQIGFIIILYSMFNTEL